MGRPRKKDVERHPNGTIRHSERKQEVMGVALNQRIRMGVDPNVAKDPLYGFALGRLRSTNALSQQQYETGQKFQSVVERYLSLNGLSRGTARSASLAEMMSGMSCVTEPTEEQIADIRNDYKLTMAALQNGLMREDFHDAVNILMQVVIRDEDISGGPYQYSNRIGLLRYGLNVLARHYRIQ